MRTPTVTFDLSETPMADANAESLAAKSAADKVVDHVVSNSLQRFLSRAVSNQARVAQAVVKPAPEPKFVPIEKVEPDSKEDASSEVDGELLESDAVSDFDEDDLLDESIPDPDEDWEEEDSESDLGDEESSSTFSNIGIPSEEEAGLRDPNITLDESQVRALDKIFREQYACLIGAAGTGKTTCTKELVHRLFYDPESTFKPKRNGSRFNVAFVAFTGMAVQVIKLNLPTWLHDSCTTIHGLLEYAPVETMGVDKKTGEPKVSMQFMPRRDANNPLDYDMIVIDESSMLGMGLWNNLRRACKTGTRILMIGDLNQLPPIVDEPIFAYAMGQWPVAELTHVHRQKGNAGKIVEIAHAVLNGNIGGLKFDSLQNNPEWRVIGTKIETKCSKAAQQIMNVANVFRKKTLPDGTLVYDPYRDRIMTAGNGYGLNGESEADMIQQAPLNEYLSTLIQPPTKENPRYIIDAGRAMKHFIVGNRVMATKNESLGIENRVTNGMTGTILDILPNSEYAGDKNKVGSEDEVRASIRRSFGLELGVESDEDEAKAARMRLAEGLDHDIDMDEIANNIAERLANADSDEAMVKADSQNWASHTIVVEFANGAVREFWSKQQVESIQLAYASTVAKCQGSQFPTAVIIIHHANKQQLCREWLYTAITRAQRNVILLYTENGLRYCMTKQKIRGNTIAEKVERYKELYEGTSSQLGGLMRRNITLEVGPARA